MTPPFAARGATRRWIPSSTRLAPTLLATAAVSGVALFACSDREPGTDGPSGPLVVEDLPRLDVTETSRLGSVDDPDLGFSRIGMVDVDRGGRIYVMENADLEIRVFSPEGEPIGTIGGRGEGPGEFTWVPEFGVVGDTAWTFQSFGSRLTIFHREGTVLSTATVEGLDVPLPGAAYDGRMFPVLMLPGGRFLGDIQQWIADFGPEESDDPDSVPMTPRVVFDATGAVVDTVGWFRGRPPPLPRYTEVRGQRYSVPRPLEDDPLAILLADGEAIVERRAVQTAEEAVFTVTRRSFAGDTVYRRQYRYRPVRYDPAYLDERARGSARAPGGAVPMGAAALPEPDPDVVDAIRSEMDFPPFQPPIQEHLIGADGGLWLQREDGDGDTLDWVVLDPNGQARGVLTLPSRIRPAWTNGDDVLAVATGDLDVPWLVRYRLSGG